MIYKVKLTIRRMGRTCQSCKQTFESDIEADSPEDALAKAKARSGANPGTHKFSIDYIRGV